MPDDVTRLATRADLDALVELYSTFEFVGGLTAWQLRTMLRHLLDRHYVIVVEWPGDDARFAGAVAITTRTRRYGVLDLLTVVPDHRGAGWSWALVAHAQSIGNALGIAGIAALAGSNPMDLDAHVARRPVRRGGTGAETTVPRPTSPTRPLRSLATTATESTDLVPRTGRHIDARSTEQRMTDSADPGRGGAAARDCRRSQPEYLMGQLIEPWPPPPLLLLRNCRSSASTLSRDSTAGRSYCMSGSFRLRIDHSPRRITHSSERHSSMTRCLRPRSVSIGAGIVMLPQDSVVLRGHLTTEGAIGPADASPSVRSPNTRLRIAARSSRARPVSRRRAPSRRRLPATSTSSTRPIRRSTPTGRSGDRLASPCNHHRSSTAAEHPVHDDASVVVAHRPHLAAAWPRNDDDPHSSTGGDRAAHRVADGVDPQRPRLGAAAQQARDRCRARWCLRTCRTASQYGRNRMRRVVHLAGRDVELSADDAVAMGRDRRPVRGLRRVGRIATAPLAVRSTAT